MRSNKHKRDATLKFNIQQLFCEPVERERGVLVGMRRSVYQTRFFLHFL